MDKLGWCWKTNSNRYVNDTMTHTGLEYMLHTELDSMVLKKYKIGRLSTLGTIAHLPKTMKSIRTIMEYHNIPIPEQYTS